ncbi:MAG: hypothetical protein NDJ89_10545 [Oligoflexia bacterium]|nr:hypothetical protein [Oligoflexia bacterium]
MESLVLALALLAQAGLFSAGARFLTAKAGLSWRSAWLPFFALLALSALAELAGVPGLAFGQALWSATLLIGAGHLGARINRSGVQLRFFPGLADPGTVLLFTLFGALWLYWMGALACLPSGSDGIHHLFWYDRMRETGSALVGRIPFLHEEFGRQLHPYYPTGLHAAVAIAVFPASAITGAFLGTRAPQELQAALLLVLAAFPVLMYRGAKELLALRSGRENLAALGAALWVGTLELFPMNPMGEGGVSRVAAQILAIPFVWRLFAAPLGGLEAFLFGAVVIPVLFWIHPSSVLVPGVAAAINLALQRRQAARPLGLAVAGACVGGLLALGILKSAWTPLESQEVVDGFVRTQQLSAAALFDRVKGLVHYLLTDPAGFGKFLSPRSLVFYLGFGLLCARRAQFGPRAGRLPFFALLLLPFLLSLLIFAPGKLPVYLGLLFYHSVKRMAEQHIWPLMLAWTVGLLWLERRFSSRRFVLPALAALLLLPFTVAAPRLAATARDFQALYPALSRNELREMAARLGERDDAESLWICPDAAQPLLAAIPGLPASPGLKTRLFVLGTDCNPATLATPHCRERHRFMEAARALGTEIRLRDEPALVCVKLNRTAAGSAGILPVPAPAR